MGSRATSYCPGTWCPQRNCGASSSSQEHREVLSGLRTTEPKHVLFSPCEQKHPAGSPTRCEGGPQIRAPCLYAPPPPRPLCPAPPSTPRPRAPSSPRPSVRTRPARGCGSAVRWPRQGGGPGSVGDCGLNSWPPFFSRGTFPAERLPRRLCVSSESRRARFRRVRLTRA